MGGSCRARQGITGASLRKQMQKRILFSHFMAESFRCCGVTEVLTAFKSPELSPEVVNSLDLADCVHFPAVVPCGLFQEE